MQKKIILYIFLFFSAVLSAQLNTDRIMNIGRNALYYDDFVLSIQYFNQVISSKPYLYEPYMYRGIAKIQLGDYAGAEADCSVAIRLNPFIPQAFYARGFARQHLEKYAQAEADLTKALEFDPENQNFIQNRMYARAQNKDYQSAMDDLQTLEKLFPNKREWLYERGRMNFYLKDTIAAEENLLQYATLDSINTAVWSMLAVLKIQSNDTLALQYLDRAIALGSDFSGDYINRGILNVRRLKYMPALADYDHAIALDSSPLAYYNRGLLRASLGDHNNALSDYNLVLATDKLNYEVRLRRAMLYQTLRQWDNALAEYDFILQKYPYFVPAYQEIAQIYDTKGDAKNAFLTREKALETVKIRKEMAEKQQNTPDEEEEEEEEPKGGNVLSLGSRGVNGNRERFFSSESPQNVENQNDIFVNDPNNALRGTVQDRYADIRLEKNFELTYYAKNDGIRRTPLYYIELDKFNRTNPHTGNLKITNRELPLTETLIQTHFAQIEQLTRLLVDNPTAQVYFCRAIEFALVRDFLSAIEDLNHALMLQPDFILALFERANIRYKLLEMSAKEKHTTDEEQNLVKKQEQYDMELVLRDYDKVIAAAPDFCFAHFNRANVLCSLRSFSDAFTDYSRAIAAEPAFAEAFFNRGITELYLSHETSGLADLSKAGELGISEAYNLLKRYKK